MATTTERGARAEERVTQQLQMSGYAIIARNWRTKWCEIDIVAKRNSVTYLIEVRYRHDSQAGGGLVSITPAKYHRMCRAGQIWLSRHAFDDVRLCVASVDASYCVQWAALS